MSNRACFDFDGVIHPYKEGYGGRLTHPCDPVVKQTIIGLHSRGWDIVVLTSRAMTESGYDTVRTYLKVEGLLDYVSDITAEKVPARVYVDDRAITYNGRNDNLLRDILTFESHTENRHIEGEGWV